MEQGNLMYQRLRPFERDDEFIVASYSNVTRAKRKLESHDFGSVRSLLFVLLIFLEKYLILDHGIRGVLRPHPNSGKPDISKSFTVHEFTCYNITVAPERELPRVPAEETVEIESCCL